MKKEVFKYDKIVLGATLEGLMYAYLHGLPVFYCVSKMPTEFETLEVNDLKWDFINHDNNTRTIKTPEKEIIVGSSKQIVWSKLAFMLSATGLMPITNPQAVRIDDDLVKITTEYNRVIRIEAKEILLFDDEGIEGVGIPHKRNSGRTVYDWVRFRALDRSVDFDLIETEYDYVNKLWILQSNDGLFKYDGCLVSYTANYPEVQNELTDYILRFTLKSIFKKYNIKGRMNGIDNRFGKGTQKYLNVKYDFLHRQVIKTKPHLYNDHDNIKCMTHLTSTDILTEKDHTNYLMFNRCIKLTKRTDHLDQVFISQV